MIKSSGPISLYEYMKLCNSFTKDSFYSKDDVFLEKGHFVTSPHVSQLFGEMLALWFVTCFRTFKANEIALVEFGAGDGTLLDDFIKTFHTLAKTKISKIVIVETSESMRKKQAKKLKKYGIKIEFHTSIQSYQIDSKYTHYVVAHEYFDALPTLKFKKVHTDKGIHEWREILVNLNEESHGRDHNPYNFRLELAPKKTKNNILLEQYLNSTKNTKQTDLSGIEIIPDMLINIDYIADLVANSNGLCLIVDYGQKERIDDTLRGIKHHKTVSPMSYPGLTDLSTNVCFGEIENYIKNTKKICYAGPMAQGEFLVRMGIKERFKQLILNNDCYKGEEEQLRLLNSTKRLVEKDSMGSVYKFSYLSSIKQKLYPFEQCD